MDEQQDNQGVVSEVNESESTSVNVEVKTPTSDASPVINDIQAPPEPEVTTQDADAVNSAVEGISTTEETVAPLTGTVENETTDAPEVESTSEVADTEAKTSEEPILKEAPVTDESENSETEKPEDQPVVGADPFAQKNDDLPLAAAAPAVGTQQSMSNNEQSLPHEHRNNKKFAVIITVIVALLLVGAAVYVYTSAQENTKEAKIETPVVEKTIETQVAEITPATSTDVDQAVSDVEQTVQSIDDTIDLNENTISDTALGL